MRNRVLTLLILLAMACSSLHATHGDTLKRMPLPSPMAGQQIQLHEDLVKRLKVLSKH